MTRVSKILTLHGPYHLYLSRLHHNQAYNKEFSRLSRPIGSTFICYYKRLKNLRTANTIYMFFKPNLSLRFSTLKLFNINAYSLIRFETNE